MLESLISMSSVYSHRMLESLISIGVHRINIIEIYIYNNIIIHIIYGTRLVGTCCARHSTVQQLSITLVHYP